MHEEAGPWLNRARRILTPGLLLGLALGASGDPLSILVTSLAPGGTGSLQEAMRSAATNTDTVIDLRSLRGRLLVTNELPTGMGRLHLVGPGPQLLAIDAEHRCRHFVVGDAAQLTLESLSFIRGNPLVNDSGGAIRNAGALTISNCTFVLNSCGGGFGGAIFSVGTLSLLQTGFISNSACGGLPSWTTLPDPNGPVSMSGGPGAGLGGALFLVSGSNRLADCWFVGNRVDGDGTQSAYCPGKSEPDHVVPGSGGGPEGGGPYQAGGFGSGGGVRAPGGFAAGNGCGGAVFVKGGSTTASNCRWEGNQALGYAVYWPYHGAMGGAIFIYDGNVTIEDSFCVFNSAQGAFSPSSHPDVLGDPALGGTVHVYQGRLLLSRTSFVSNSVVSARQTMGSLGSALAVGGGTVTAVNCTFAENQVLGENGVSGTPNGSDYFPGSGSGGAVAITNGSLRLEHCTVCNNRGYAGNTFSLLGVCPLDEPLLRSSGGCGILQLGGSLSLRASILSGNGVFPGHCDTSCSQRQRFAWPCWSQLVKPPVFLPQDGAGRIESLGYNVIAATNGLSGLGALDLVNVTPAIGPLRSRSGHPPVQPLLPGSVGINAVPLEDLPAVDAEGTPRPQGPLGEVGAVEVVGEDALQPPVGISANSTLEIEPGGTARLFAPIWALPGTRYQWFHNGVAVPGATDYALEITHATAGDLGAYTVDASNQAGKVTGGPIQTRFAPLLQAEVAWAQFSRGVIPDTLRRDVLADGVEFLTSLGSGLLPLDGFDSAGDEQFLVLRGISADGSGTAAHPFPARLAPGEIPMLLTSEADEGRRVLAGTMTSTGILTRAWGWADSAKAPIFETQVSVAGAPLLPTPIPAGEGNRLVYRVPASGVSRRFLVFDTELTPRRTNLVGAYESVVGVGYSNLTLFANWNSSIPGWQLTAYTDPVAAQWSQTIELPGWTTSVGPPTMLLSGSPAGLQAIIGTARARVRSGASVLAEEGPPPLYYRPPDAIFLSWGPDGSLRAHRSFRVGVPLSSIRSDDAGSTYLGVSGTYIRSELEGDLFGNDALRDGKRCLGLVKLASNGDLLWSVLRTATSYRPAEICPDGMGGCYVRGWGETQSAPGTTPEFDAIIPPVPPPLSYRWFVARIASPLRLHGFLDPRTARGLIQVWGEPGRPVALLSSQDLKTWVPSGEYENPTGVLELPIPPGAAGTANFYRVARAVSN